MRPPATARPARGLSRGRPAARPRARPWRSLARAASWHRRPLAAIAAALAVLTGISAALPEGPPTTQVVVAAHQLAGGAVLAADDVELRAVRVDDVPEGALTDPAALVGRSVAAPVAGRQVLTGLALVSARAGVVAGRVVAPVRLADAGLAALLHPGDLVDVIAADPQGGARARVVAAAVRVVTVPVLDEDTAGATSGTLVLVSVPAGVATDLAQAGASGSLTVSWR